jgi:hypothetical protein
VYRRLAHHTAARAYSVPTMSLDLKRTFVALPLAVAIAAAGCGGGDDAPSKEEFAKQADAICADLEKQSNALGESNPQSVNAIAEFAAKAKKTAEDGVKRINDLEVPSGSDGEKAKEWQKAITDDAEQKLIPALEELEAAAKKNDTKGVVAAAGKLQKLDSSKTDQLARDIGATRCAD